MIYVYARVSTKGQFQNGKSIKHQIKELKENGAEVVYSECFTGTKVSRPKFDELLSVLKRGEKLIVTKLDRFARSASQGIQMIEELIAKGITVQILLRT